jgi:prevent-host-death family protein
MKTLLTRLGPVLTHIGTRLSPVQPVDPTGLSQFNMHEAKTHLARLVERASTGEQIVIARYGVPLAKLGPYDHAEVRVPGVVSARILLDDARLPRGRL